MTLGQLFTYLNRIIALAIAITAFVMQLEPARNFRAATLNFDGHGHATYASTRLRGGDTSYPILFMDDNVRSFLDCHKQGGEVDVLLRPDNGIVEMRQGDTVIFSVDQYIQTWDRSKSAARKWLFSAIAVILISFVFRRSLL
ncbi:hypothetical protein [Pseudomonas sp.]|uniref:hypothetical protein n=1 Tax=Pseudomonas sp. TaxID=306 RepID=UPI003D13E4EC